MKITRRQLKRIIQEELARVLDEQFAGLYEPAKAGAPHYYGELAQPPLGVFEDDKPSTYEYGDPIEVDPRYYQEEEGYDSGGPPSRDERFADWKFRTSGGASGPQRDFDWERERDRFVPPLRARIAKSRR